MAINLTKGQRIEIGLSKVGVGLGWDPNEGTGFDFDLDASAFMLGENKKGAAARAAPLRDSLVMIPLILLRRYPFCA